MQIARFLVGDRNAAVARWLALAASVATFVVSLLLWREFDTTTATMQFVERQPWIGAFNAWYHLGVDGISLFLLVLMEAVRSRLVLTGTVPANSPNNSGRRPHRGAPTSMPTPLSSCAAMMPAMDVPCQEESRTGATPRQSPGSVGFASRPTPPKESLT